MIRCSGTAWAPWRRASPPYSRPRASRRTDRPRPVPAARGASARVAPARAGSRHPRADIRCHIALPLVLDPPGPARIAATRAARGSRRCSAANSDTHSIRSHGVSCDRDRAESGRLRRRRQFSQPVFPTDPRLARTANGIPLPKCGSGRADPRDRDFQRGMQFPGAGLVSPVREGRYVAPGLK
jgi:hypothetical protein